ncbi:MAG: energy-coupling factor transporter ATPase [Tissierellia bacterium]|nr:energy-coupling factor transporter ATPase [Tissierellia bacterium]
MKIELRNVDYIYNKGKPFEVYALKDINLIINQKDFIGLIGHTGSGKSTLVQHLNGLYKPSRGQVLVGDKDINAKGADLKEVRQKVGLVFQYPEHQLFEETIYKDIAYGPINMGLSEADIEDRVIDAMNLVGLDYEKMKDKSPFELSGGQKRRVAIAGVLAMHPRILILDEPTAGLDPKGRDEILDYLTHLHDEVGICIVLVSHSMEDIAKLANRILVMDNGEIVMDGSPQEIFDKDMELSQIGLGVPQITEFMKRISKKYKSLNDNILTVQEAFDEIDKLLGGKKDV